MSAASETIKGLTKDQHKKTNTSGAIKKLKKNTSFNVKYVTCHMDYGLVRRSAVSTLTSVGNVPTK